MVLETHSCKLETGGDETRGKPPMRNFNRTVTEREVVGKSLRTKKRRGLKRLKKCRLDKDLAPYCKLVYLHVSIKILFKRKKTELPWWRSG